MKRYFRFWFMILLFAAALVLPIAAKRPDQHHADTFEPSFSFSTLAFGEETEGKPEPDSSSILNT